MITIKRNFNTKNLSTFKIGGRARYFCEVKNDNELREAIAAADKLNVSYKIIAGGSNAVFPDKLLNCLLIRINSDRLIIGGNKIVADAGVPLSRVVALANKNGLRGLETLAGIPGTVGGAIVGNAGAYGHSISEVVERVEILDGSERRWLNRADCRFSYRESVFKKNPYIILRASLKFKPGKPGDLQKISRDTVRVRREKYKPGLKCPGSFFKNVLAKDALKTSLKLIESGKIIDGKIPAGYLLEQVGAKGMRLGGIRIADFHGNLFVNAGRAKADDVKKLAKILKSKVKRKFGILLEEEVRYF